MNEILSRIPKIIQGGMGVAISDYELARAVARAGEKLGESVLAVVSGTCLTGIMVDRLQNGNYYTECALREFDPEIAEKIIKKYAPNGSKSPEEAYKLSPKPEVLVTGSEDKKAEMTELAVAAAFVEVRLAKEGHNGPIGINLLEKIQLMHLPTLLGAMLAGVDYVLVGAGIPIQIPKVLNDFANGQPASYRLNVEGLQGGLMMTLDPKSFMPESGELKRPKFFPIISSHVLAQKLNKIDGVDGFVVEGPLAGGHNAPARGKEVDGNGEPIYGEKDEPDLARIADLGKPFYLAGGYATPEKLEDAKRKGATGIQAGTVFALCNESGMREDLAEKVREKITSGTLRVECNSKVSPSGYPFMVAQLEGTLSQEEILIRRDRSCKYGFLVQAYQRPDGSIGFRCSAESVGRFVKKGGKLEDTEGKACLCAGLLATADHAHGEPPIVTLGKELGQACELMQRRERGGKGYSAEEVLLFLAPNK